MRALMSESARAREPERASARRARRGAPNDATSTRERGDDSKRARRERFFALAFAFAWIAIVYAGERRSHVLAQGRCSWPSPGEGAKVMVVADPQLVDEHTYREFRRDPFALSFVEAVCDAYVRRAMKTAMRLFSPDKIIFLGDLFGQGARRDEGRWDELRRRVDAALLWPRDGDGSNHRTVVGNHDVGYSEVIRNHPNILKRFEKWYGASNFVERVGGADFIGVNAMVLDGRGPDADDTWAFVESLRRDNESEHSHMPRVLLTHLPLPNPSQKCGPSRQTAVIAGRTLGAHREIVYQDYLSGESAQRLLEAIEPELILSGHDHDQCEVTHSYASKVRGRDVSVKEITVGTVSALNGNDRPSYLMLTVSAAEKSEIIEHKLCLLPEIREVLKAYSRAGIFTILIILGLPLGELIQVAKNSADRRSIGLHLR